jgi:hypothetical protein
LLAKAITFCIRHTPPSSSTKGARRPQAARGAMGTGTTGILRPCLPELDQSAVRGTGPCVLETRHAEPSWPVRRHLSNRSHVATDAARRSGRERCGQRVRRVGAASRSQGWRRGQRASVENMPVAPEWVIIDSPRRRWKQRSWRLWPANRKAHLLTVRLRVMLHRQRRSRRCTVRRPLPARLLPSRRARNSREFPR